MSIDLATTMLAAVLALGAGVMAVAALRARSLFVTAGCVAGVAALAAGGVVLLGGGDGALALAAFGVGVAPVIVLGGVLLSARTAKTTGGGAWVSAIAVVSGVGAAVAIMPELGAPTSLPSAPSAPITLWLGALVFTCAAACVVVLGYGERGALRRHDVETDS